MRRVVLASCLLAACKAELGDNGVAADASRPDSPQQVTPDASTTDAAPVLGPWGTPTQVPGASSASAEDDGTLSSNLLELYFKRVDVATAPQDHNIYVMKRASASDAWGTPTQVPLINGTGVEESPRLSPDDLTMYFGRAGDIYKTTRASTAAAWGAPTLVAEFSTAAYEKWRVVCGANYGIVSRANGANGQDLYEGTLGQTLVPIPAANMNTTNAEQGVFMTPDCLKLYFQSNRDGDFNIYLATRTSATTAWGSPTKITDFNQMTTDEEDVWISADERTFLYTNNSSGNKDVYIVTR